MSSVIGIGFNEEALQLAYVRSYLSQNIKGISVKFKMTDVDDENIKNQLKLLEPAERMKKLVDVSDSTAFSNDVPLERYLKSMLQMRKMAIGYINDAPTEPQSVEKALVLLLRFCRFAMKDIPCHPQYAHYASPEKAEVFQLIEGTLQLAERVKEQVRLTFQMDYDSAKKYLQEQKLEQERKKEKERQLAEERANKERNEKTLDEIQIRKRKAVPEIVDPNVGTAQISFADLQPVSEAPGPSKIRPAYPDASEIDRPTTSQASSLPEDSDISGKTIRIAYNIIEKFLNAASVNTVNNIETCGILCGKQEGDSFVVNHVILPKQRGTADTCYAEGEIELLEVQRTRNLLTLGWIHTHPSQTAFLSSVDLHMHFAYQTSMNEAVAIVCAPKYNKVGTFVLSTEGMHVIGSCQRREFHEHPEASSALFVEASHVCYVKSIDANLIDLRSVNNTTQ